MTFPTGPHGPGRAGEPAWAAAACTLGGRPVETAVIRGLSGAAYAAGLLALREGALQWGGRLEGGAPASISYNMAPKA